MNLEQSVYSVADRAEVLPFLPADGDTILDIGCARGGFGAAIRASRGDGVRLVGVEPSPEQAEDARRSGYNEVRVGFFPDALDGSSERFDCIVLNDVLEHMLDPWDACAELQKWLTPGGAVVASIPSIQYLPVWLRVLRGHWQYTDHGTLDRTHVRFFTRRSMVEMFESAGFAVEKAAGINSMADNLGRRWRLLLRPFRRFLGDVQWLQFVVVARVSS